MRSEPIVSQKARPKGEKRRSAWPLLLFVLGVLGVLTVVPFLILRPQADIYLLRTYETALVARGTLIEYVRTSGTLVPRIERSVVAPGEGTLLEWLVAEGDEVTEEQVLGRLSSPALEREVAAQREAVQAAERRIQELQLAADAAVRQEARELERAQQALAETRQALATTRALYDIGAVSRSALEAAELAVRQAERSLDDAAANASAARAARALAMEGAEAQLRQAQEALALAEAQLGSLELRAPVAGQVIRLNAAAGDRVDNRALLATVASAMDLQVNANLAEAQAQRVGVGMTATIRVAGQAFAGSVAHVSPQTEVGADGAPVVPITLVFAEAPRGLRVGASASVEIEVGRVEEALYLPRGPYLTTGGERLAYVVEGETASRQTVVFGIIDGNRVEVRDGLSEGQRVIVSSYEAFRDRAQIRLAPEGEIR